MNDLSNLIPACRFAHVLRRLAAWSRLAATAGLCLAATPGLAAGAGNDAEHCWTADNGNGTYSNPLFYGEFEDPDVIRVGDDYYLAGTTMHMMPAVEILHSKDLVNWELAGYCTSKLDLGPAYRLEGGNIYGNGIWAPCIRYHNGMFYILCNVNRAGLQVFRSKSINGPWERNQLPSRHDMSVLFDDDGKIYLISGGGSPYPIEELAPDLRSFDTNAPRHALIGHMGEGHHLYKIQGKYVDISCQPGGAVDEYVAVADTIDGPWRITKMVAGESLGVTSMAPAKARANDRGLWIHQGGMCDTPSGEWWSIIMSDHGSAGRMVNLVPITWDDGFPLIGLPGNLRRAPNTWIKPNTGCRPEPMPAYVASDDFEGGRMNPHWQWNHVPDDAKWSLTEQPGVLRLHSLASSNLWTARNSLCQRPAGPESIMTVELATAGMSDGDAAGLGLLSTPYAWIGVVKTADGTTVQKVEGFGSGRRGGPPPVEIPAEIGATNPPTHLWFRVACNFDRDEARFSWSTDGQTFTGLGKPFTTTFQLTTFQGVRVALFHYNTSGQPGGFVNFDNYSVDQPRARGREREIPLGKTITLASGADGSFLAMDPNSNELVNLAADATNLVAANTHFKVVDLRLGRVALQAADGRYLAAEEGLARLKDLGGQSPGPAESFQWVNLLRGDTMLMALVNHRYLATTMNHPGPVAANFPGPTPARKGGECFKWQVVK